MVTAPLALGVQCVLTPQTLARALGVGSGFTKTVTIPAGSHGSRWYTANWATEEYSLSYDLGGGSLPDGSSNPETYIQAREVNTMS